MQNVPPDLHRSQGVNHLNKVLDYAPLVEAEGRAIVHLTAEDWHVVADTLFHMDTPREFLPEAIIDYSLKNANRTIELKTKDVVIEVEMI